MISMRTASFRVLAIAASVGLGSASLTEAQTAPATTQPTAPTDPLTSANSQVDQTRAALEAANTHADAVSARLDADRQQAKDIRQRLSRGDAALPEIKAKLDSATGRLSARKQEMALADMHYAPLKFADDQARLNAIGEFEKSPEYRAALQAISDAGAAAQTMQAESLRRFSAADEYQQALSDAQSTEGRAKLDALKDHHLAADPNVAIAQGRVASAKAALDALRTQFMEQGLPQIPKVADADEKLKGAQTPYDVLAAAAATAERDQTDASAMLERQHAGLVADRVALDQVNAQINQLQTELATTQANAALASDELNRTTASADAAQQARQTALAATQPQSQPQVIYQSTTYQYAPPPVVYQQPAYVPAPYYGYGYGYGGIIVVPSRTFGFGFSGSRGGFQGHADFHGGHDSHGGGHGGGHR